MALDSLRGERSFEKENVARVCVWIIFLCVNVRLCVVCVCVCACMFLRCMFAHTHVCACLRQSARVLVCLGEISREGGRMCMCAV